jgi:dihydroorotase-like cyclic amidohydrolase
MLDAFHSLTKTLGVSIGDAAKIVSTTPARIANLPNVGAVEPGRRADFVLFKSNSVGDPATSTDPAECADPTTVTHVATMIAGDTVFDAANP